MTKIGTPETHPFIEKPNRTLLALSFPVLLSLIAEPLTGLIDTAFIAQLGEVPLAALGVGTTALSSTFWVFNFLAIGTQTEVAQAIGRGDRARAVMMTSLALIEAVFFGLLVLALFIGIAPVVAGLVGAEGAVLAEATVYLQVRLFGAPAVLITIVGFGALRGLQDMRTPLIIAVAINALNIALDPLFIFGAGPVPASGVAGGALASVGAQWVGAAMVLWAVGQRLGYTRNLRFADAVRLVRVGGDLFVRTGALVLYMLLATRIATQIGAEAGAAHQVIRQVWFFSALIMEAFAVTAQSLVGYFYGSNRVDLARRVAVVCVAWSLGTGLFLVAGMLITTGLVTELLVPAAATAVFGGAWIVAALAQPVTALAFVTDGIHWGTEDYAFLRNAMLISSVIGGVALFAIDISAANAFTWVWIATTLWIAVRALFGIIRIWPGTHNSPLRLTNAMQSATNRMQPS